MRAEADSDRINKIIVRFLDAMGPQDDLVVEATMLCCEIQNLLVRFKRIIP